MEEAGKLYWKTVLSLIAQVLVVWAVVSYGFGILLAPVLDNVHLGGYPLGFWFAQQGSELIFIVLIFFYAWKMGKIDEKFDVHED